MNIANWLTRAAREFPDSPALGLGAATVADYRTLGARAAREQLAQTPLDSPEAIHRVFAPQLAWLRHEKLVVALLDTRLRHNGTIEISNGSLNETTAHPREILRHALLLDATAIVGAVLGAAGLAGLAIGFAFRDLVENYIASILLSV